MKLNRLIIKTADYRKSFKFYHDILGLRLKTSWQRSDSEGSIDCSYIPERSKTELFFEVSNINSARQKFVDIEGLDLSSIEEMPWGYRIFSVFDPDHVKIVFAQPI